MDLYRVSYRLDEHPDDTTKDFETYEAAVDYAASEYIYMSVQERKTIKLGIQINGISIERRATKNNLTSFIAHIEEMVRARGWVILWPLAVI